VPFLIFALLFCLLLALGAAIALSLALRYRAGTARRLARRWVATVNLWSAGVGAAFFMVTAACLSLWIRQAFPYALMGLLAGAVLGLVGLIFTRWESEGEMFYYTPNRWLVLVIVVALVSRLAYGWWRGAHAIGLQSHSLPTASGTALSLAVAAAVIGYYLVYAIGVRSRLAQHHRRLVR
jgi:hypothetical protein